MIRLIKPILLDSDGIVMTSLSRRTGARKQQALNDRHVRLLGPRRPPRPALRYPDFLY